MTGRGSNPRSEGEASALADLQSVLAEVKLAPGKTVRRRSRRLRAAGLAAWGLFTGLTILVRFFRPEVWDLRITRSIQLVRFKPFRLLMWLVSEPGFAPQTQLIPLATAGLLTLANRRREAAFAIATLPAQWLVSLIKLFFQRARPAEGPVIVTRMLRDTSFPSGHTVHYVTFYGYLWYLAFVRLDTGLLRTIVLWGLGALVVLVGPSRVYLGHHWASDVLGGYALGLGWLIGMIDGYRQGAWPVSWRWGTSTLRAIRRRARTRWRMEAASRQPTPEAGSPRWGPGRGP